MKRTILTMLLMAVVCVGCTQTIPAGVKGALYTSEITLRTTADEAAAATKEPWVIPADATLEQKLAKREVQVDLLTKTMAQAAKNLEAVVEYFRTEQERNANDLLGGTK